MSRPKRRIMYLLKENYFNIRKDEITTEKIVRRLTNFCIYLINEIAKGDIEKENELIQQMIKENYFNIRKDEITTEKIVRRLTNFCIYLINEIAKGDVEKANELTQQMIKKIIEADANEDIIQESDRMEKTDMDFINNDYEYYENLGQVRPEYRKELEEDA